jgi:hypothetical protein
MVVRVPDRTYDVYVTPPEGGEQPIAVGHRFRTGQQRVRSLSHVAVFARDGSHQMCGFSGP